MAAFLRKKITPEVKPVPRRGDPSPDQSPPPLFAKFATTYQGKASNSPSPRFVSSPMPLSNNNRRREPAPEYSRPHASGDAVFRSGSRAEKESDASARLAASSSGILVDPTLGTVPSPNGNPNQRQPRSSNSGSQLRQDRPSNSVTKVVSRPAVDKPLPDVKSDSSLPPLSSIPTNRGAPAPSTPPYNHSHVGLPTTNYTDKPLPQPSRSPLPPKPDSVQRQDQEAEQFGKSGFGDPQRNVQAIGHLDDAIFPSVPVQHGPTYSLIAPRAPNPAKSLPLKPEDTHPTPNPASLANYAGNPSPHSRPDQPTHTHSHAHRHRRQPAGVEPSYEVAAIDHHPPNVTVNNTASRDGSHNRIGQSPRDAPEPWHVGPAVSPSSQDYDGININIQPTVYHPSTTRTRSDQSIWPNFLTDAYLSPSDPSPVAQNSDPSETHVSLGHSNMGASTSSLSAPSPRSSPPTPRSNPGKSRTLFTPPAPEEHATNDNDRIPRTTTETVFQPVLPLQPRKASSTRSANNQQQRTTPVRGKPLIFAAMATMEQADNEQSWSSSPSSIPDFNQQSPQFSSLSPHLNNSQQSLGRQLPPSPLNPEVNHHHHHHLTELPGHPPNQHFEHAQPSPKYPLPSPSRKLSKSSLPTRPSPDIPSGHSTTTVSSTHASSSRTRTPDSADITRRAHSPHRVLTKVRPTPMPSDHPPSMSQQGDLNHHHHHHHHRETPPNSALELLGDDPFAKADGVRMLKPTSSSSLPPTTHEYGKKPPSRDGQPGWGASTLNEDMRPRMMDPPQDTFGLPAHVGNSFSPYVPPASTLHDNYHQDRQGWPQQRPMEPLRMLPLPPVLAPQFTEVIRHHEHQEEEEEEIPRRPERKTSKETEPLTLVDYLSHACVLAPILTYLTFYDWCVLSSVSKRMRTLLGETYVLREVVLEQYLSTVGYRRWGLDWSEPDPLALSLQDLTEYMRGVSIPTHEYARVAEAYLQSGKKDAEDARETSSFSYSVAQLTSSSRAYTRVVLRLRAQAEAEQKMRAATAHDASGRPQSATGRAPNGNGKSWSPPPPASWNNSVTYGSSRAPSPAQSLYSQGHSLTWNNHSGGAGASSSAGAASVSGGGGGGTGTVKGSFRSPLFRLGRAPLLRVFVPSPEDWLSDKSVLRCEAELRHAGVSPLMRAGDVVWDVAVGDEGNVGRMVWDGSYLIDLDYSYSAVGDLPKYMHALVFPPSYFHKVIRTGPANGNPIVHVDISPWGDEIAVNLQLLQDRIRTETPQGTYHNVVRWVHRSSFLIQRPAGRRTSRSYTTRARPQSHQPQNALSRLVIPGTDGLSVDAGWYGTVVVEAEGTNEGLADLQERCGPGVFPPRAGNGGKVGQREAEARKVFRILRERSRPGEIWIRTVREKERFL